MKKEDFVKATTETPCHVNCTECDERVYECGNEECDHIFMHEDIVYCNLKTGTHLCGKCYNELEE